MLGNISMLTADQQSRKDLVHCYHHDRGRIIPSHSGDTSSYRKTKMSGKHLDENASVKMGMTYRENNDHMFPSRLSDECV